MNPTHRNWQVKTLVTSLVLILLCGPLSADSGLRIDVGGMNGLNPCDPPERIQIGLALSGGGARGLSYVGLIRAFEEKGIEIAAVAGTSIGGIVGGLYACGYTTDELTEIVKTVDIGMMVSNRPQRRSMFLTQRQERERYLLSVRFDGWRPEVPRALTGGQEITSLLTRLTLKANYLAGHDFTRFPIPFTTVATDVISGQLVVFSRGSLADAVRSSMAFPLALTGVDIGDRLLMDGGMLVPVPVEIVRSMVDSGTTVVAVDATSPLGGKDDLLTPFDIAGQVTTIMTADKREYQLGLADLVLTPVGPGFTSTDFDQADSLISLGYEAGLAAADSIIALASAHSNPVVYRVCELRIVCPDSALASRFRGAGLEKAFTRSQLAEDLKTLVRTEPVFRITAEVLEGCPVGSDADSSAELGHVLKLQIWPQPKVREMTLRIEGNTLYDDLTLAEQCDFPDSLLAPSDIRRALDRIINLYRTDDYDMVEVRNVSVDLESGEITVRIDEVKVGRIDVADNVRTRDWLVRSYFPIRRGRPFSVEKAIRGMSDLYGTELFERVTLDLEPQDSVAIVTIGVKEKKYSQVRLGWHWHDEYQSEQFIELLDDNVNGIGLEFLTHLQYGPDHQLYYTGLRLDRIFFTYLTARLQMSYDLLERNLFSTDGEVNGYRDENRWGGAFYLGQQIARLGQVRAGLRIEEIETIDHREETSRRFGLRTLHFESEIESFDRFPFPTSGGKHRFDLRFAVKVLGGEVEYSRFSTSLEAYYPLGPYLNYHPRVSIGLSRRGLPPSEKFYLGGLDSFSGYRTNELSGEKMFLLNQELRLKLPFRFYLSGRFDYGGIYASAEDIKPSKFRRGFGVVLSFDSPIGPFHLGYGAGDAPKERVYFSAGFSF